MNISELKGKVINEIINKDDELIFICQDESKYKLYHSQDCCECVTIDNINGDLNDLIGSEILVSEEVKNEDFINNYENKFTEKISEWTIKDKDGNYKPDSYTWTFYKLATVKGYVDIRWFGESNGYYSEGVDFIKADKNGKFKEW